MTERTITTADPSPTPIACVACGQPSPFPLCAQCEHPLAKQLQDVARRVVRSN